MLDKNETNRGSSISFLSLAGIVMVRYTNRYAELADSVRLMDGTSGACEPDLALKPLSRVPGAIAKPDCT